MKASEAAKRSGTSCRTCPWYTPGYAFDSFDDGYVAGAVLGDGSLAIRRSNGNESFAIILSVTDKEFAKRFREHAKRWSRERPWIGSFTGIRKANELIGMPETEVTEWRVIVSSRELYDILKPYKIDRVYESILKKSNDFLRGFIQGFIDADGYQSAHYIDIANKDMELLETAMCALHLLGERATIHGPYPYSRGVAHLRTRVCFEKTRSIAPAATG